MYPLLPTMQGANAAILIQAIDELKTRYAGTELSHRLLWLRTLLGRAESISDNDKKAVEKEIDMFDELLDEDPYLLDRDAHVAQKAKLEQLQDLIVDIVQDNFPDLTEFAQSRVTQITKPEVLRVLAVQLYKVSSEEEARTILKVTAA